MKALAFGADRLHTALLRALAPKGSRSSGHAIAVARRRAPSSPCCVGVGLLSATAGLAVAGGSSGVGDGNGAGERCTRVAPSSRPERVMGPAGSAPRAGPEPSRAHVRTASQARAVGSPDQRVSRSGAAAANGSRPIRRMRPTRGRRRGGHTRKQARRLALLHRAHARRVAARRARRRRRFGRRRIPLPGDRDQGAGDGRGSGSTDASDRGAWDTSEPLFSPLEPGPLGPAADAVPSSLQWLITALAALAALVLGAALLATRPSGRSARRRRALLGDLGLLQSALLPPVPGRVGGLGASVAYRPWDGPGAGGAFYDVFPLANARARAVIGEVAGHGRGVIGQTSGLRHTLRAFRGRARAPCGARAPGRVLERDELIPDRGPRRPRSRGRGIHVGERWAPAADPARRRGLRAADRRAGSAAWCGHRHGAGPDHGALPAGIDRLPVHSHGSSRRGPARGAASVGHGSSSSPTASETGSPLLSWIASVRPSVRRASSHARRVAACSCGSTQTAPRRSRSPR